jgi:hypothetical protein
MSHLPTNTTTEQALIDALKQLDDELKKYIDEQIAAGITQKVAGLQQEIESLKTQLNYQATSIKDQINKSTELQREIMQLKEKLNQRPTSQQSAVEVQTIQASVTGLPQTTNTLEQKPVTNLPMNASYSEVIKHLRNQNLQLKNSHMNLDQIDVAVQKYCSNVVLTQSGTNISVDEKMKAILLVLLFLLHKSSDKITKDTSKFNVNTQMKNHVISFGFSDILQWEIFQNDDKCFALILATAKIFKNPDILPGGNIHLLYDTLNTINNQKSIKPPKSKYPN